MNGYSLFQGFNDPALAKQLTILFDENDIPYQVINNSYGVDITFSNNKGHEEVQILIPNNVFDKAYVVLDKSLAITVAEADPDHYLFEFDEEELIDVIRKRDEWSRYDYLLARRIAKERGTDLGDDQLADLKGARVKELETNKNNAAPLITGGLVCAVLGFFIASLLLWTATTFLGWQLWRAEKALPNKSKVRVFSAAAQARGFWLFILGAALLTYLCISEFLVWV